MKTIILAIALCFASTAYAADKAPAPSDSARVLMATCNDGSEYWTTATTHQGACARHGGVKSYADGSPVKARGGKKGEYRPAK